MIFRYLTLFILIGLHMQASAQTNEQKVSLPYEQASLIIDYTPKHPLTPYEIIQPFVFENDSLFQDVRFIELDEKIIPLPDSLLSMPLVRFDMLDHCEVMYLLDKDKRALAAVIPREEIKYYYVQWLSNGKNSKLKQRERVTFNMNMYHDTSNEYIYIGYDENVLIRHIDRTGLPEDFELTITYWDKDFDGIIEKKVLQELIDDK